MEFTKEHWFAIGITALWLCLIYFSAVQNILFSPAQLTVCQRASYQFDAFVANQFEKERIYVPDYDAKIRINKNQEKIKLGDTLIFNIVIENKSINKLENPYLYLFLFKEDGKLGGSYPCDSYTAFENLIDSSHRGVEGYTWVLFKDSKPINPCYGGNRCLLSFDKNISLTNPSVQYIFKITDEMSNIGNWEIHALLFDGKYFNRKNNQELSTHPYSNSENYAINAFAFAKSNFNVVSESPPPSIHIFILGFLTIMGLLNGVVPFFSNWYKKRYAQLFEIISNNRKILFYVLTVLVISFIVFSLL